MPLSQKNKYHSLLEEIGSRATLIAVSKKRSLTQIRALYHLGQRDFGENRVDELIEKSIALKDLAIRWHFIGNLQSKKLSKLLKIKNLVSIHSVDRLKLLELLVEEKACCEIFLQVNISKEAAKSGFINLSELEAAYTLAKSAGIKVVGLMAMAGIRVEDQVQAAREQFDALRCMRDQLDSKLQLSIGMSNDYKIALDNDAKYLRIGSLLFS